MNIRYGDLEYDALRAHIIRLCHSGLGKERAQELAPFIGEKCITKSLALISQIQECLRRGLDFNFEDLCPVEKLFVSAEFSIFGFEEFRTIYQNTRLSNVISRHHEDLDDFRELHIQIKRLQYLPEICARFDQIFDAEGEVLDSASPELARIRKRAQSLRGSILKTMQNMMSDSRFERFLQDKFVTQREDRFVLPIKEGAAANVPGIVQSHSGSKSTLFIEPESVVPLNNELQMIKQEEKREIYRIFSVFTTEIKALRESILGNVSILAELDFRYSCGRFSNTIGARIPRIVHEPILELRTARHPLLILKLGNVREVIPFDLSLGKDYRIVILSGPNTGGKTVLMKSAGLITLMALSGLPVPADEDSKIGMFESVFADIGDDQSIENALSTFSSHVEKIQRMLTEADENSLVLIDEIGAATDPQQGSALAQAILERFGSIGSRLIVTTHYTALKIFGEQTNAVVNASMQFDLKSLHPTFRFSIGFPGDSFAIEVASSLGMESSLIERAKSLSGSQNTQFTELLKKMQDEKKALARATYEFELKTRNLATRLTEAESKEAKLEEELKARRQKYIKDLQNELIAQQKLYTKELEELKTLERGERKSVSEKKLHAINERLDEVREELVSASSEKRKKVFQAKPGDRVWLPGFQTEATVLEIRDNQALVDMNGISFKTPVDSLFEANQAAEKEPAQSYGFVHADVHARFELKLLGLTFDEAQPLIDEFIDDAVIAGLHNLRIVHGKGTGILRSKVRDYLCRKKQVLGIDTPPMNQGGSGVTLVKI
ncbi:MAG: endonuclease MutS2 [Candidatus Cloacimonadaceae bacterium]|nr:endonuclease MutS2 [Candidatus Cloacimonadaceae bacterium]